MKVIFEHVNLKIIWGKINKYYLYLEFLILKIINCNENGYYSTYTSDNFGFNNFL